MSRDCTARSRLFLSEASSAAARLCIAKCDLHGRSSKQLLAGMDHFKYKRDEAGGGAGLSVGRLGTSKSQPKTLASQNRALNIEIRRGYLIFSRGRADWHMAICPNCNQRIKETVLEGRRLIAQVHTGQHVPPGTGRYVTVMSLQCACSERIVRRYENGQVHEVLAK